MQQQAWGLCEQAGCRLQWQQQQGAGQRGCGPPALAGVAPVALFPPLHAHTFLHIAPVELDNS